MSMHYKLLIKYVLTAAALQLPFPCNAGLLDLVNALPANLKGSLPTLSTALSLPKDPDGISTSLQQAYRAHGLMSGYTPDAGEAAVGQVDQSGMTITTGFYDITVESYCIRAGAYRPKSSGNGYLLAPLQGPKADIVKSTLRNSYAASDIPQRDVQTLIWAILSGTKISKMSPTNIGIAQRLLSTEELFQLNNGVIGLIPDELLRQLVNKANAQVPESYKRLVQSYADLKSTLESASGTFEELERIAVPEADANSNPGNVVKPGQWMLRDGDYFVRVMPKGYRQAQIQIYRPVKSTVTYDAYGRVSEIDFHDGSKTTTKYSSQVRVFVDPDSQQQITYSIVENIRFEGPSGVQQIAPDSMVVFHARDFLRPRIAGIKWSIPFISEAHAQEFALIERAQELYKRFKDAKEIADALKKYEEERQRDGQPLSQKDQDAFLDEKFYYEGLMKAFKLNDLKGKAQWLHELSKRMQREVALMSCRLSGGCLPGEPGPKRINLPDHSPVPGSPGYQRLALSPRLAK